MQETGKTRKMVEKEMSISFGKCPYGDKVTVDSSTVSILVLVPYSTDTGELKCNSKSTVESNLCNG